MPTSPSRLMSLRRSESDEDSSTRWSLGQDSDVLTLSQDLGTGTRCVELTPDQCHEVRDLGAAQQCLQITVAGASPVELVLVGKRIGAGLWGGWASRADDAAGVVAAVQRALVFAEQILAEEMASRQRLYERATRDPATGLPNGRASRLCLEEAIADGASVTVMTLGVLNYRSLRGMLGMSQSEELMKQVAMAIGKLVPPDWTLCRLGGPEFRLHADGARSDGELATLGARILRQFAQTFFMGHAEIRLQAAIGAARVPDDASTVDELEVAADAAMHAAMSCTGDKFQVYARRMHEELAEGLWLDAQLHEALDQNELELWYQPKVDLRDGSVGSVEALIRWRHRDGRYIAPDKFIPRAEASGFIVSIGRWVVKTAAQQAAAWSRMGRPLRVSVNVSAKQVTHDPSLVELLQAAQAECGGLMDIELTESSFLEDPRAAQSFIQRCRALGCGVHLDDFGTGYSSLGQLALLELTAVKLDRSFISTGAEESRQRALLAAISGLAQALALDVIAEGVETEEMAVKLRSLGVQCAQGWHYCKAVPAGALMAWLGQGGADVG